MKNSALDYSTHSFQADFSRYNSNYVRSVKTANKDSGFKATVDQFRITIALLEIGNLQLDSLSSRTYIWDRSNLLVVYSHGKLVFCGTTFKLETKSHQSTYLNFSRIEQITKTWLICSLTSFTTPPSYDLNLSQTCISTAFCHSRDTTRST